LTEDPSATLLGRARGRLLGIDAAPASLCLPATPHRRFSTV
jgi:hypothetical protein